MSRERKKVSEERAKELGLEIIEIIKNNELSNEEELARINDLILEGADINLLDEHGTTPIANASRNGNVAVLDMLLKYDADVNTKCGEFGNTALHYAAERGNLKIVDRLLRNGANANACNVFNVTPLVAAYTKNHFEVMDLLLKNNNDPSKGDDNRNIILDKAVRKNQPEIVELLLKYGANQYSPQIIVPSATQGTSSLIIFAIKNFHLKIIELLAHYFNPAMPEPLIIASKINCLEAVTILLNNNAEPNLTYANSTALHAAAEYGNLEIMKLLIKKNAKVKAKNDFNDTALHLLIQTGCARYVSSLLTKISKETNTPIGLMAQNHYLEVGKLLIKKMTNINTRNLDGKTPLHIAAEKGLREFAKLLIENAANSNIHDANGQIPLHLAAQKGHLETVNLLLETTNDIDIKTKNGHTALFLAAKNNHLKVVDLLIRKGADLTIIDTYYYTQTAADCIKDYILKEKLLKENYKKLEIVVTKLKLILREFFTRDQKALINNFFLNIDSTKEKDLLLNNLKQASSIESIKESFKNLAKSQIKDLIKKDQIDKIQKLLEFLEHNKDLISDEEVTYYKISIHQYNYIKGIALRETIKNIGALKVIGSFLSSEDTKILLPEIFHSLITEFKKAFANFDFEKTSKIYHTMVRYDEEGILIPKGIIDVQEEDADALECGGGKGASDSVEDRRSGSPVTYLGGVEERKGEDPDNTMTSSLAEDNADNDLLSSRNDQILHQTHSHNHSSEFTESENFIELEEGCDDTVILDCQPPGYLETLGAGAGAGGN